MKLLTKQLRERFERIERTMKPTADGKEDPPVIAKFFQPWGSWTWYATEYHPEHCEGGAFFGLVDGLDLELGYFALAELESVQGPAGLRIERDLWWKEKPLSEVQQAIEAGRAP